MSINTESTEYITQELLKVLFTYNAETGELTRRITTSAKSKVNSIAGYLNDSGYLEVMLFGNKYLVHRLIWIYVYGKFPVNFIDHIDGGKINNRIENLREATNQENAFNSKVRSDSSSGYTGVSLDKRCGKYRAYLNINGKQKSLGYYPTALDAHLVREKAAKEVQGAFYRENTNIC